MTGGGGTIEVVQVRGELDLALADSLAVLGLCGIPNICCWWAVIASVLCRASALALPACEVPIHGVAALPRQARHRHHRDRGHDYRPEGVFIPGQVRRRSQHNQPNRVLSLNV